MISIFYLPLATSTQLENINKKQINFSVLSVHCIQILLDIFEEVVTDTELCLLFLLLSLGLSQHHLYRQIAIAFIRELKSWYSALVSLNFALLELLKFRLFIDYIRLLYYLLFRLIWLNNRLMHSMWSFETRSALTHHRLFMQIVRKRSFVILWLFVFMIDIFEKTGTFQPNRCYSLMKAGGKHLIIFFAAYSGSHWKDSWILCCRKLIDSFRC